MEWPKISIIIPTYNRVDIVCQTVVLLYTYLRYSGEMDYWMGVDGDDDTPAALEETARLLSKAQGVLFPMTILDGPRRKTCEVMGLGANLNMLISASDGDLLLQMDDDHHLVKELNIDPHAKCLIDNAPEAGWIRLMGAANHQYTAVLRGKYWYVDWGSSGPYSLYIPSNRPHLKRRDFHDFYGMYPKQRKLGETEEAWCHQCKVRAAVAVGSPGTIAPQVLVPLYFPNGMWKHVGRSWQGRGE